MPVTEYLESFVYRGKDPSSGEAPAWHITMEKVIEDGGEVARIQKTMSVEQAKAAGINLSDAIGMINEAAIINCQEHARKSEDLEAEINRLGREASQTISGLQATIAELSAQLAAAQMVLSGSPEQIKSQEIENV